MKYVTCEICGYYIDIRQRYKKLGDRYQHMEQECCTHTDEEYRVINKRHI